MPKDDDGFGPESLNWTNPAADEIDELENRINPHPGKLTGNRMALRTRASLGAIRVLSPPRAIATGDRRARRCI